VTFRTFDLGGDKSPSASSTAEANPMLGCRGIRLLLEWGDLLVSQIRALLRASHYGPIRIMFPLITSLTEFQETMLIVRQIEQQLRDEGVPFDNRVPYGCMIETPAAATIADILASEVEFLSIGSNDLIQYTLAADRTNLRVAHIYEPLHLAVLRMMRTIIRAGHRRDRTVSLCGEMAADPIYSIILLGMGVDELSMSPVMIPAIKQIIRGVTWAEARRRTRRSAPTARQRRGGLSREHDGKSLPQNDVDLRLRWRSLGFLAGLRPPHLRGNQVARCPAGRSNDARGGRDLMCSIA